VTKVKLNVVSFAFERAAAFSEGNARQLLISACWRVVVF